MTKPNATPPRGQGGQGRLASCGSKTWCSKTDADLLAVYLNSHSQEAFRQIVARHRPMVFRACHRLLPNLQDVEDAVQATFLLLVQHPELVKQNLAAWLHEVARGVAIDLLRARSRRADREKAWANGKPPKTPIPDRDMLEELNAALAKLPTRLRKAVYLRYIEGRSVEEAAILLGCPSGTLGRQSFEGLKKLRSILVRRGAVSPPPAEKGRASAPGTPKGERLAPPSRTPKRHS